MTMILFSKLIALAKNKSSYSSRTGKITANLFASLFFKALNIIINFVMVPLTLNYLDKTRYGLWAALSSVLAWFFIFDIGIGNGLRNKIIELKTKKEFSKIRSYVSTAYVLFSIIAVVAMGLLLILNRFLDWSKILKAPASMKNELSTIVVYICFVMCATFVIKLLNSILLADLKNAINDGLSVITHIICILGIVLLAKFTTPSLLSYALLYTGANLVVLLVASFVFYSTMYKDYAPKFSAVDMSLWHDLVNVGIKFFVIQIAAIVFFQTTSFILSNLVGPDSVTDYNITQKYFSMMSLGFAMLAQPLWSGFGDAYHSQDFKWINKTIKRLQYACLFLIAGMVLMILAQKLIFRAWVGDKINIDYALSALFIVYISLQMWNTIYSSFINATSKLKLSLYLAIFFVPIFIPGSIFFVKYLNLGAKGILVNLILLQAIPAAIIGPLQTRKIISNVPGIWNQ